MYLRRVVHVLWNSLLFWQMMMMIDLAFSSSTHTVRQVIKYRFSNTFIATKSWMKLSERLNKISKCAIYEKLNFFRDTTLRNYQGYGSIKPFCCLFWTHNLMPIFLNGPSRPLFCLLSVFPNNLQNKNCRLQQDSNSNRQNWRREGWPLDHHHGQF